MAYVSVPKDLTKVKNKVAFNLTKRQLICIGIGAAMGIPSYFLLRNVMGNSNAATVMVLLMLPAFLFAMYEKDGMHLEDVLMHMIRVKFLRPPVRKYETENYYETDLEQIRQSPDAGKPKGGKTVAIGELELCIIKEYPGKDKSQLYHQVLNWIISTVGSFSLSLSLEFSCRLIF